MNPDKQADLFNTNRGEFSVKADIWFENHLKRLSRWKNHRKFYAYKWVPIYKGHDWGLRG